MQPAEKPKLSKESLNATEAIFEGIYEKRQQQYEGYLNKVQIELQTAEKNAQNEDNRSETRFEVQFILKDLRSKLQEIKGVDFGGFDPFDELHALITHAKKLDSALESKGEKILRIGGKTLMWMCLAVGLKGGVDKFQDMEEVQQQTISAMERVNTTEGKQMPHDMPIIGDESVVETPDTSALYVDFVTETDKLFHGGLRLVKDVPHQDFEKVFISYGRQLHRVVDGFDDRYVDQVAHATDRTPEQMRFVASVANDALYADPFTIGNTSMSETIYATDNVFSAAKHQDWYEAQYRTTLAFLDRVFEEKMSHVSSEARYELQDELAGYIGAEMQVRARKERLKMAVEAEDEDSLEGREASQLVSAQVAEPELLQHDLSERDHALTKLYGEMIKQGVAQPQEVVQARIFLKLKDLQEIHSAIADHLGESMRNHALSVDGELMLSLLEQLKIQINELNVAQGVENNG